MKRTALIFLFSMSLSALFGAVDTENRPDATHATPIGHTLHSVKAPKLNVPDKPSPATRSVNSAMPDEMTLKHSTRAGKSGKISTAPRTPKTASEEKEPTILIEGKRVNLTQGVWKTADGSRSFWMSNEYPDVILSPAEYRHYVSAQTGKAE